MSDLRSWLPMNNCPCIDCECLDCRHVMQVYQCMGLDRSSSDELGTQPVHLSSVTQIYPLSSIDTTIYHAPLPSLIITLERSPYKKQLVIPVCSNQVFPPYFLAELQNSKNWTTVSLGEGPEKTRLLQIDWTNHGKGDNMGEEVKEKTFRYAGMGNIHLLDNNCACEYGQPEDTQCSESLKMSAESWSYFGKKKRRDCTSLNTSNVHRQYGDENDQPIDAVNIERTLPGPSAGDLLQSWSCPLQNHIEWNIPNKDGTKRKASPAGRLPTKRPALLKNESDINKKRHEFPMRRWVDEPHNSVQKRRWERRNASKTLPEDHFHKSVNDENVTVERLPEIYSEVGFAGYTGLTDVIFKTSSSVTADDVPVKNVTSPVTEVPVKNMTIPIKEMPVKNVTTQIIKKLFKNVSTPVTEVPVKNVATPVTETIVNVVMAFTRQVHNQVSASAEMSHSEGDSIEGQGELTKSGPPISLPPGSPNTTVKNYLSPIELFMTLSPSWTNLFCSADGEAFREPVDVVKLAVPRYYEFIRRPVDLSKILQKLYSGQYSDPWDYIEDVQLMFENAWYYNKKRTAVYRSCTRLSNMFRKEMEVVMERQGYCCGSWYEYRQQALLCHKKPLCLIQFREPYYCYRNRVHICVNCFQSCSGETVRVDDEEVENIFKELFEKKVHDVKIAEPFVRCGECGRRFHALCVQNLKKDWPNKFLCKNCVVSQPIISVAESSAASLPSSHLASFIQQRVDELLAKEGVMAVCGTVTVSILTNVNSSFDVNPDTEQCFRFSQLGNLPGSFPYRTKGLFVFQNREGLDVCLFGMYVQEYNSYCPEPNRGRVYLAYLDSVHFFQPRDYRTLVYHEVVLAYLDYVKQLGYHTAHIWMCPSLYNQDYIFRCHPPEQKMPSFRQLKKWYHTLLAKGVSRGIVLSYESVEQWLIEEKFYSPTQLPYFCGDQMSKLLDDSVAKVTNKDGSLSNKVKQLPTNHSNMGSGLIASEKGVTRKKKTEAEVVSKEFFRSLRKYQDTLMVVKLRPLDQKDKSVITDPDPLLNNQILNNREEFVEFAHENCLEFSSLRHAKFSTTHLLRCLHDPNADQPLRRVCNVCRTLNAGDVFHCLSCADVEMCGPCHRSRGHDHPMRNSTTDRLVYRAPVLTEPLVNPSMKMEIYLHFLVHASECRVVHCPLQWCSHIKEQLSHIRECRNFRQNRCQQCCDLFSVFTVHALRCKEENCLVIFCRYIKKVATLQQQEQPQEAALPPDATPMRGGLYKESPGNRQHLQLRTAPLGTIVTSAQPGHSPTCGAQGTQQVQQLSAGFSCRNKSQHGVSLLHSSQVHLSPSTRCYNGGGPPTLDRVINQPQCDGLPAHDHNINQQQYGGPPVHYHGRIQPKYGRLPAHDRDTNQPQCGGLPAHNHGENQPQSSELPGHNHGINQPQYFVLPAHNHGINQPQNSEWQTHNNGINQPQFGEMPAHKHGINQPQYFVLPAHNHDMNQPQYVGLPAQNHGETQTSDAPLWWASDQEVRQDPECSTGSASSLFLTQDQVMVLLQDCWPTSLQMEMIPKQHTATGFPKQGANWVTFTTEVLPSTSENNPGKQKLPSWQARTTVEPPNSRNENQTEVQILQNSCWRDFQKRYRQRQGRVKS